MKTICAIILIALVSCSKRNEVRWVPKDGLWVVTAKDEMLFSSKEMQGAHIVLDADGSNRTIWIKVSPEAFERYFSSAEPFKLQMNGATVATFEKYKEPVFTGPPAFPVPDTRTPDGRLLSAIVLDRIEEVPHR